MDTLFPPGADGGGAAVVVRVCGVGWAMGRFIMPLVGVRGVGTVSVVNSEVVASPQA